MRQHCVALGLAVVVAATVAAVESTPILRYRDYLVIGLAGQDSSVRLQSQSYGATQRDYTYSDPPSYAVLSDKGEVLSEAEGRLGETLDLTLPAAAGSFALLEVQAGNNYVVATPKHSYAYVATPESPLSVVRGFGRLYFWVPPGLSGVTVMLHAFSVGEAGRLLVYDPADKLVQDTEGDFNTPTAVSFPVPPSADGQVWSLALVEPRHPGWKLDDCTLWLAGSLPGVLATRATWAEDYGREFARQWTRVLDCEEATTIAAVQWDRSAPEGGPQPSTTVTVSPEKPWTGKGSVRIEFAVPRELTGTNQLKVFSKPFVANRPRRVNLWLYGDGSGRKLIVRLRDQSQEQFYAPAAPIDWTGWGQVTVDFQGAGVTHSGGDENGVIDGPQVTLVLQFQQADNLPRQGLYYVDDVAVGN